MLRQPGALAWLVLALAFLAGFAVTSSTPVAAAGDPPVIGSNSCGGATLDQLPNDYCWFQNDAAAVDIVIGNDSCNGLGSCGYLGDGATIGDGSCNAADACYQIGDGGGSSSIGDGSCTAQEACFGAGSSTGASSIGDGSCTAYQACFYAGYSFGSSAIGDGSCTAQTACDGAGYFSGSSKIGDGSCTAQVACKWAGYLSGSSEIGDGSCTAQEACQAAGYYEGSSSIGDGSCNGAGSCSNSDATPEVMSSIGDYSCNTNGAHYTDCQQLYVPNVGDCMYNDPDLEPDECKDWCDFGGRDVADEGSSFNFRVPCKDHDACYETGGSESDRTRCDANLRSAMRASCVEMWPANGAMRLACYRVADDYYNLARRYGKSDFNAISQPPRPLPGRGPSGPTRR